LKTDFYQQFADKTKSSKFWLKVLREATHLAGNLLSSYKTILDDKRGRSYPAIQENLDLMNRLLLLILEFYCLMHTIFINKIYGKNIDSVTIEGTLKDFIARYLKMLPDSLSLNHRANHLLFIYSTFANKNSFEKNGEHNAYCALGNYVNTEKHPHFAEELYITFSIKFKELLDGYPKLKTNEKTLEVKRILEKFRLTHLPQREPLFTEFHQSNADNLATSTNMSSALEKLIPSYLIGNETYKEIIKFIVGVISNENSILGIICLSFFKRMCPDLEFSKNIETVINDVEKEIFKPVEGLLNSYNRNGGLMVSLLHLNSGFFPDFSQRIKRCFTFIEQSSLSEKACNLLMYWFLLAKFPQMDPSQIITGGIFSFYKSELSLASIGVAFMDEFPNSFDLVRICGEFFVLYTELCAKKDQPHYQWVLENDAHIFIDISRNIMLFNKFLDNKKNSREVVNHFNKLLCGDLAEYFIPALHKALHQDSSLRDDQIYFSDKIHKISSFDRLLNALCYRIFFPHFSVWKEKYADDFLIKLIRLAKPSMVQHQKMVKKLLEFYCKSYVDGWRLINLFVAENIIQMSDKLSEIHVFEILTINSCSLSTAIEVINQTPDFLSLIRPEKYRHITDSEVADGLVLIYMLNQHMLDRLLGNWRFCDDLLEFNISALNFNMRLNQQSVVDLILISVNSLFESPCFMYANNKIYTDKTFEQLIKLFDFDIWDQLKSHLQKLEGSINRAVDEERKQAKQIEKKLSAPVLPVAPAVTVSVMNSDLQEIIRKNQDLWNKGSNPLKQSFVTDGTNKKNKPKSVIKNDAEELKTNPKKEAYKPPAKLSGSAPKSAKKTAPVPAKKMANIQPPTQPKNFSNTAASAAVSTSSSMSTHASSSAALPLYPLRSENEPSRPKSTGKFPSFLSLPLNYHLKPNSIVLGSEDDQDLSTARNALLMIDTIISNSDKATEQAQKKNKLALRFVIQRFHRALENLQDRWHKNNKAAIWCESPDRSKEVGRLIRHFYQEQYYDEFCAYGEAPIFVYAKLMLEGLFVLNITREGRNLNKQEKETFAQLTEKLNKAREACFVFSALNAGFIQGRIDLYEQDHNAIFAHIHHCLVDLEQIWGELNEFGMDPIKLNLKKEDACFQASLYMLIEMIGISLNLLQRNHAHKAEVQEFIRVWRIKAPDLFDEQEKNKTAFQINSRTLGHGAEGDSLGIVNLIAIQRLDLLMKQVMSILDEQEESIFSLSIR
jgi:hypothetical protein